MDATLEVRWFQEGTPPEAITDWFDTLDAEQQATRTDLYLHPANPAVNVKLRASGKAQTKRRVAGGRAVRFAEGRVAGRAEPWRKFSFKTKSTSLLSDEERATGLWMPVEKTRDQRTLGADALADLIASPPAASPPSLHGVEANIELTRVGMEGGTPWWTICVETEGPPEALWDALTPAAEHFLSGFPPGHTLSAAQSLGYAQWLRQAWHPEAVMEDAGHETQGGLDE